MAADLHLHTTASDGTLAPKEIVEMAFRANLTGISITDHDTLAGLHEAIKRGQELEFLVIPGIELSTLWDQQEIHILGYFIHYESQELKEILHQVITTREKRAIKMIENLNKKGFLITLAQVKDLSKTPFIGRPHIARALKEQGYIQEISDAFTSQYIGRGGEAYVERWKITPMEAILLIKEQGGYAILAHPGLIRGNKGIEKRDLNTLIHYGLDGIEVFYSGHKREQRDYYLQLALEKDLLITGGSDFHSPNAYTPQIGPYLPHKYLQILLEKAQLEKKI